MAEKSRLNHHEGIKPSKSDEEIGKQIGRIVGRLFARGSEIPHNTKTESLVSVDEELHQKTIKVRDNRHLNGGQQLTLIDTKYTKIGGSMNPDIRTTTILLDPLGKSKGTISIASKEHSTDDTADIVEFSPENGELRVWPAEGHDKQAVLNELPARLHEIAQQTSNRQNSSTTE